MAYTPTNWVTGDTVTATKLNKMEQGIANAGGGVSGLVTDTSGTLDVSYDDLFSMLNNGVVPFMVEQLATDMYGVLTLVRAYIDDGMYTAEFYGGDPGDPYDKHYVSSTADGSLVFD